MNKLTTHHSCLPAIEAVPKKDQPLLKDRLMEIFGNPCRTTYYKYINDYRNIPFNIKMQLDRLFTEEFGIAPECIWTEWTD